MRDGNGIRSDYCEMGMVLDQITARWEWYQIRLLRDGNDIRSDYCEMGMILDQINVKGVQWGQWC
jgi:hypothetical protein